MRRSPPVVLTLIASTLVVTACRDSPPPSTPPVPVRLLTLAASAGESVEEHPGVVAARVESELAFRVGGQITRRLVADGAVVQAGQPLFELDPKDAQLGRDGARAAVEAARVDAAVAADDAARYAQLRANRVVAEVELARRNAAADAARARLADAQSRLAQAEQQVRYTTLRAPAAGVITGRLVDVGTLVSPGQPVARLAESGARDVVIDVSEADIGRLRIGDGAEVQLGEPAQTVRGTVREKAAAADPASRTFRVRVAVSGGLAAARLGSTATVRFRRSERAALRVPLTALLGRDTAAAVYVLPAQAERLRRVPVRVLGVDGDSARVEGALAAGTRIVVLGVQRVDTVQRVAAWDGRWP